MELFIRADDIYMEIHKVTLKEGHVPMIGDQLPSFLSETDYGYCNPHTIEPAVWFKVMVVDSISIDCTKRAIMWNSDSSLPYMDDSNKEGSQQSGSGKRRRRVSESMYIGGELYGFETDLDELFDTLQLAVGNFASSQITRDEFNSEIMRMLHCHVLPVIKLTTEDIPKMKQVLADEQNHIRDIDAAILEKDKQMDSIAQAMHRQREAFLSSFITLKENDQSTLTSTAKSCNKELAQILVEDCESDLLALHQKLDDMQREVQEAKQALADHEGVELSELFRSMNGSCSSEDQLLLQNVPEDESEPHKKLREKREERNESHRKLKKLLCARENLRVFISEAEEEQQKQKKKSFMKSFKSSPQHQPLPIHNVYMGMRDTLKDVRSKAKALVDKKVLMISVKEALRTTLEELHIKDETLGSDVGVMFGSRPTDVLNRSRKPKEWLSLAEKVSDLIGHHSNQVCLQHSNFSKIVADRCHAVIYEKKLVDVSHNAARTGSDDYKSSDEQSRNSDSGCYVENKLYSALSKNEVAVNGEAGVVQVENTILHMASPVNSIVSDSSDLGTGSESRNSSGSTSQSELSNIPTDSAPTAGTSVTTCDSLIQVEGQLGDEDIVIVHNSGRDHLRRAIDDLKQQVHEHFTDIVKLIQTSINSHTQTVTKKVWLCYEHHFYEATMEPLMELYNNAFKSITERLENLVPDLSVEDLDLDDTVIANMLEEKILNIPPESQVMPEPDSASEITSDTETDPFNTSSASQTKSEPVSPASDDYFTPPPEVLNTGTKASERRQRSFRGRLMTHPAPDGNTKSEDHPDVVTVSECTSPSGLSRIKIHYPMSVTMVRNRQSWPQSPLSKANSDSLDLDAVSPQKKEIVQKSSTFDNIRKSLFPQKDNNTLPSVKENSNDVSPIVYRDVKLKPDFQEKFAKAKECLKEVLEGVTPLMKLQSLMRCLREVTNCLSEYQFQYNNNETGACSDDIIDMLIILLLNCDVGLTAALYPQLMFLADTLPPFFEGGPYQFCLVQFSVAYQFLQDRLLLKNRSLTTQQSLIN